MTSKMPGISPLNTSGVGGPEGHGEDEANMQGGDPREHGEQNGDEAMEQQDDEEKFLFGPDTDDEAEKKDATLEDAEEEQHPCEEAPIKMPESPSDPTPEERERHNKTHVPYRSWCSVCKRARGREDKHLRQTKEERALGLPKVSMDYAQIEDVVTEEQPESEEQVTHKRRLMVGRDRWTGYTFNHLVECKGLGDHNIVKKVTASVDGLGYRKLIVKTDGEPAIVAVQEAVARARTFETIAENPPAHDPQANGEAERAVSEVKAQMRAVKIGLEMRLKDDVDVRWPVIEWMIPHAADVLNRFSVGTDGKTPHYRVFHRFFKAPVFEFGEQVWAKPLRETNWTKVHKDPKRKLSLRTNWIEGTWVGFSNRTNEHFIVVPDGGPVLRVRTVRMRPPSERWSITAIKDIKATPDLPNPKDAGQKIVESERNTKGVDFGAKPGKDIVDHDKVDMPRAVRDFKITDAHLEEFGFTKYCPGCDAKRHGTARRGHTADCRIRIEEAIRQRYPEDPAIARRDERHAAWADQTMEQDDPKPETPADVWEDQSDADMGDEPVTVDEDKPDDDDDLFAKPHEEEKDDNAPEVPAEKRRRLAQMDAAGRESRSEAIERSVKQIMENLIRKNVPFIGQLCTPEGLKEMMRQLDEKATKKMMRDVRRTERQNVGKSKKDVAEAYSPPRMTAMAEKLGWTGGAAMDVTRQAPDGVPWDLSDDSIQKKALKQWEDEKPWLLTASPPCTMFCTLQNLSIGKRDAGKVQAELEEAIKHLAFSVFLCMKQAAEGRKFMIEHPASASSWQLGLMNKLLNVKDAQRVTFDFCDLGMQIEVDGEMMAVRKRTSIVTNSVELAEALRSRQRRGDHEHANTLGGRIKQCQVYPPEFCELVCRTVLEARDRQECTKKMLGNVSVPGKDITSEIECLMSIEKAVHKHPHDDPENGELYSGREFFDDNTGKELDFNLAVQARRLEMKFFRDMKVYTKVYRSEAHAHGSKVITTRWLDINKGDDKEPNYRSRLVGRELKLDNRLDLFAATPPLEALRILCSMCASNQDRDEPFRIMSIDVRRAYFYAKVTRPVFIEIPEEDREPGDELKVARLNLSLYGTRDAAQNWAAEYTGYLLALGFEAGAATPTSFRHVAKDLFVTVHGDDFTVTGPDAELQWLQQRLSDKYEIKTNFLGPEQHHQQEIRVLNRTIRWTQKGVEYEPDQRHAELLVREMGMETSKPVATPGVADTAEEHAAYENSPELTRADATLFRGMAARLNYLSLDRPDLQFAAKECAKRMARPREADWNKLKRVARYLVGKMRLVQEYEWQELPASLHTYTDSDWAGDKESRKSTSGGAVTWGMHTLKTWASTQQVIALSSGEAELYALVKGAAQSYGIMSMLMDFNVKVDCTVCTDASAAIGIVHRQGLGKTRHIDVQYLWVQREVYEEKLKVIKVGTDANPADLLTKFLKAETVEAHLENLHYSARQGRADTAPDIMVVAEPRRDRWEQTGNMSFQRIHNKPRTCLFTPMRVAGGPINAAAVGDTRVTTGTFGDGRTFTYVDSWKNSNHPHRALRREWTGQTRFMQDDTTRGVA